MDNPVRRWSGFIIAAFILPACVSLLSAGGGINADQAFSETIAGVSRDCPRWIPDYQHFDKQLEEAQLTGVDHHREWPPWRLL